MVGPPVALQSTQYGGVSSSITALLIKVCFAIGPTGAANTSEGATDGAYIKPFVALTTASVEALRYRGEDIARSLTKTVVKEVNVFCPMQRLWAANDRF